MNERSGWETSTKEQPGRSKGFDSLGREPENPTLDHDSAYVTGDSGSAHDLDDHVPFRLFRKEILNRRQPFAKA